MPELDLTEDLKLVASELKRPHVRFIMRQLGRPLDKEEANALTQEIREAVLQYTAGTTVNGSGGEQQIERVFQHVDTLDTLVRKLRRYGDIVATSPKAHERVDARTKGTCTILYTARQLERTAQALRQAAGGVG